MDVTGSSMSYGMYISAEGAQAQSRRLEVISNNLANVDTVGFKRDVPSFQARFAEAIQQRTAQPGDRSRNDVGGGVKVIDVQTDFATGNLQRTGQDLDIAIVGDGFFQVRTPSGEVQLTRAGNFQLDPSGTLVTKNGNLPVLDQSGRPIQIVLNQPWSFDEMGLIEQAGTTFVLGMMQPESLGDLVKVGNNRFRPLGPVRSVPPNQRHLRQGYLEMSGANATEQMMTMIETSRAFEANTRMIQNHDSMTSSLISRVLQR